MIRWIFPLAFGAGLMVSSSLHAQGGDTVPAGYEPPPGMCRIWVAGVPADRQPAPTDCATAIRRKPPNARVVFGERHEQRLPVAPLREDEPRRDTAPARAEPATQRGTPRGNAQPARREDRRRARRPASEEQRPSDVPTERSEGEAPRRDPTR